MNMKEKKVTRKFHSQRPSGFAIPQAAHAGNLVANARASYWCTREHMPTLQAAPRSLRFIPFSQQSDNINFGQSSV